MEKPLEISLHSLAQIACPVFSVLLQVPKWNLSSTLHFLAHSLNLLLSALYTTAVRDRKILPCITVWDKVVLKNWSHIPYVTQSSIFEQLVRLQNLLFDAQNFMNY